MAENENAGGAETKKFRGSMRHTGESGTSEVSLSPPPGQEGITYRADELWPLRKAGVPLVEPAPPGTGREYLEKTVKLRGGSGKDTIRAAIEGFQRKDSNPPDQEQDQK